MSAYSKITIIAPESAEVGEVVDIEVRVKSLANITFYVTPVVEINGDIREGTYETLIPGAVFSWYFNFTMPDRSVTITANSWCEDTFEWHLDDTAQKTIYLPGEVPSKFPVGKVLLVGALLTTAIVISKAKRR